MKKVLVLCTGNICRSQIAEGYLKHFANGKAEIYSEDIYKIYAESFKGKTHLKKNSGRSTGDCGCCLTGEIRNSLKNIREIKPSIN